MKWMLLLLVLFLVQSCEPGKPQAMSSASLYAIDGDTLSIDVRLRGVDAPELDQMCLDNAKCVPCGRYARAFLRELIFNKAAQIEIDRSTSYGRLVGTVSSDNQDIAQTLIEAGWAIPIDEFLKEDPVRQARYFNAYANAERSKRGMHGMKFDTPYKWRSKKGVICQPNH